jgi:hypothetical protein
MDSMWMCKQKANFRGGLNFFIEATVNNVLVENKKLVILNRIQVLKKHLDGE